MLARRKMRLDQRRQFLADVAAHAVVRGPGRLRSVEIKTGADAEIPLLAVARQVEPARRGIAGHQHQAQLRRQPLCASFDHEGFFGAGQAREKVQRRHRTLLRLRRQVHRKAHLGTGGFAGVRIETLRAAEAGLRAAGDDGRHQ
jgi:hypothetical protein